MKLPLYCPEHPRCPFCGKYVKVYIREGATKRRFYPDDDPDGIAECRTCGQIEGFMEESPTAAMQSEVA